MSHYLHRYVVESSFPFPIDMLRHDGAFPVSEHGSGIISDSIATTGMPPTVRSVELACVKHTRDWEPDRTRWRSHLWTVAPLSHSILQV